MAVFWGVATFRNGLEALKALYTGGLIGMPEIDIDKLNKDNLAFSQHTEFKKISNGAGGARDPFASSDDPQAFFPEPSRLKLLELFSQLVLSGADSSACQGVLVLGNKGVGKTALAQEFLNHHAEELDVNAVLVNAEQLDSEAALFKAVLEALGVSKPQCANAEDFQQALSDMVRLSQEFGRSVLVMIDDGHHLAGDLVTALLKSSMHCIEKNTPIYWVFFSEPGLERVFEALSRKHKVLGIERNFHPLRMQPFSYEDMAGYIDFKFQQAGLGEGLKLQGPQLDAIFSASQGNAGLVPNATHRVLGEWANDKNIVAQMPRLHLWTAAGVAVFVLALAVMSFPSGPSIWGKSHVGEASMEQLGAETIIETKPSWFLEQSAQSYTLQLVGGAEVGRVDKFIAEYSGKVGKYSLYKLRSIREGKTWYVVFCGVFDNRASATAFMKLLPETLQNLKPWVRSFQHIQQDILSKQAVSLLKQ